MEGKGLSNLSCQRKPYDVKETSHERVEIVDLLVWFSKTKVFFSTINMLSVEDSEV